MKVILKKMQCELKAPKNQRNTFGGSIPLTRDIAAIKPLKIQCLRYIDDKSLRRAYLCKSDRHITPLRNGEISRRPERNQKRNGELK